MRRRAIVVVLAVAAAVGIAVPALGLFGDSASVGSNTFTTATLNAPTLNTAAADALLCKITLAWSAPGTGTAPDSYDVRRSTTNGGPYSFVKHVGVVTTTDDTGLAANTTYYYVLQSTRGSWTSVDSNQKSAKTALLCI